METVRLNYLLTVFADGRPLRSINLVNTEETLVGSAAQCQVVLNYPTVSRRHGRITICDQQCRYEDLGSRNGSKLRSPAGEFPLAPCEPVAFHLGQELVIGPFVLRLQTAGNVNPAQNESDEQTLRNRAFQYLAEQSEHCDDLYTWARTQSWFQGLKNQNGESAINIVDEFLAEQQGDGPVTPYINDPSCKEIIANDFNSIFVDQGRGLTPIKIGFSNERTFGAWVHRLVLKAGRRLDLQNPLCEGTLPNGARLQAVMAPISRGSYSVAIRRYGGAPVTEAEALDTAWISERHLTLLKSAVAARKNIVIAGGTSSGKTTLLNFLSQYFQPGDRIVTVEDTFELSLRLPNVASLQARRSNADGVGEITIRQLVQTALRMRPDRLIVGEVRGAEVIELLQALNTGHPGSLTTIHANSANEALARLELLALMSDQNLSSQALRRWIRSSIDLVVFVERLENGIRNVTEIMPVHAE